MKTVRIGYDSTAAKITVDHDPLLCSVKTDKAVRWQSDLDEWRVIFSSNAPINPKVASPGTDSDTLELKANRPEDLRHVKYVVVAYTEHGLRHLDPELIVDP